MFGYNNKLMRPTQNLYLPSIIYHSPVRPKNQLINLAATLIKAS